MSKSIRPALSLFAVALWLGLVGSLIVGEGCTRPDAPPAGESEANAPDAEPSGGAAGPGPSNGLADALPATGDSAAIESNGEAPGAADEQGAAPHFNPLRSNGTIFDDWAPPKLALVITGMQHGYLEPCGCAGLENQKGGLSRRHTFFEQVRGKGWPMAAVDVGGLILRFGRQAEIKFDVSVEAMKEMGYSAIAFGADDLRLSAGSLAQAAVNFDDPSGGFVAANVDVLGLVQPSRTIEAGGMKIGVTAILGDIYRRRINNSELSFKPPAEALAEILPQLDATCDVVVLLAHATREESIELAQQFPQIDVVVSAREIDEPPLALERVEGGKAVLVEVGHKGMFAVTLGFYDDPDEPVRYQRVPLDSRFSDSAAMRQIMASYQRNLESQVSNAGWAALESRRPAHPRSQAAGDSKAAAELLGRFVGSAQCGECHTQSYEHWKETPHAHATDTLVHLEPARHFDPECVSCHVTGWNPQEYFPYESGFDNLQVTPLLTGNGCENCHGPGGAHVAMELGEAGEGLPNEEELRAMMRITPEKAEASCLPCHDLDNSPDFDFETYWPDIAHPWKD